MASQAKMTIRVRSARGSSTVQFSSTGRYVNLVTAGYQFTLPREPIQPTSSNKAFWTSVLAIVQAQITAEG
jgi:hypothetical protein